MDRDIARGHWTLTVIPGRAEGASPESRNIGNTRWSGFRARRFAASRNDEVEMVVISADSLA
jgi:hypothetical protein